MLLELGLTETKMLCKCKDSLEVAGDRVFRRLGCLAGTCEALGSGLALPNKSNKTTII